MISLMNCIVIKDKIQVNVSLKGYNIKWKK